MEIDSRFFFSFALVVRGWREASAWTEIRIESSEPVEFFYVTGIAPFRRRLSVKICGSIDLDRVVERDEPLAMPRLTFLLGRRNQPFSTELVVQTKIYFRVSIVILVREVLLRKAQQR